MALVPVQATLTATANVAPESMSVMGSVITSEAWSSCFDTWSAPAGSASVRPVASMIVVSVQASYSKMLTDATPVVTGAPGSCWYDGRLALTNVSVSVQPLGSITENVALTNGPRRFTTDVLVLAASATDAGPRITAPRLRATRPSRTVARISPPRVRPARRCRLHTPWMPLSVLTHRTAAPDVPAT